MLTLLLLSTLPLVPQSRASTPPAASRPAAKPVQPAARAGHNVVYDTARKTILLINGDHATDADKPGELLAWNGKTWTLLDARAPTPRTLAAVAFDSKRGRLVMQGGLGVGDLVHGDTVEWDGTSWRVVADATKGPGVRNHHAAAFDAGRGVVVLFGGQDRELKPLRDTWEWNGSAWTQVATTGPGARVHHDLVYDPVRKRTLLFGGSGGSRGDLGDLWEWDGTTWTQRREPGGPSPRAAARMTFDAGRGEVVLFGGRTGDPGPFAWDGTRWRKDAADTLPPDRSHHALAYDAERRCLVLFGGYAGEENLNDTWERDASGRWTRVGSGTGAR